VESVDAKEYVNSLMSTLAHDLTLLEGLTPLSKNTAGVLEDLEAPAIVAIAGTRINLLGMIQLEIYYSKGINEKVLMWLKKIDLKDSEMEKLQGAKLTIIQGIFSRFTEDIIFSTDPVIDDCVTKEMQKVTYNNVLTALLRGEINSERALHLIRKRKLNHLSLMRSNLKNLILKIRKYLQLRKEGNQESLIKLKSDIEREKVGCGLIKAKKMLLHYPVLLERLALCDEVISLMEKVQILPAIATPNPPILEPTSPLKEVEGSKKGSNNK